ncbi:hypothetical protein RhiirA5_434431 [Rhizophagus irregularis]|uniref:Uncharacterized protein n=1 Tax=Rhizophagus irregularis TaxID=588596 RepID=A0A2N0NQ41_9GLOM|nr:hypothetical protein RhiirA5_434431 [Rhizophagus irregularis]
MSTVESGQVLRWPGHVGSREIGSKLETDRLAYKNQFRLGNWNPREIGPDVENQNPKYWKSVLTTPVFRTLVEDGMDPIHVLWIGWKWISDFWVDWMKPEELRISEEGFSYYNFIINDQEWIPSTLETNVRWSSAVCNKNGSYIYVYGRYDVNKHMMAIIDTTSWGSVSSGLNITYLAPAILLPDGRIAYIGKSNIGDISFNV